MPNKMHNYKVDLLPDATATYNLGSSSKKWLINGVTPGDAMAKGVDTSISQGSTSTNLPTTAAVVAFISSGGIDIITNSEIDALF